MKVTLISHTPDPEKSVAAAARLCYSDSSASDLMNGLTDKKAADFVEMLSSFGHMSPVEHISFTFGIEGVSRTFLAQITRHRLASFSVQSQRYVKKKNFIYITPPEIENDKEALEIFNRSMQESLDSYNRIADILQNKYKNEYIQNGMSENAAKSKAEKKAIEDARFVLPNACETKMVMTMNARELIHFFRMRCCSRAQWEIRAVAEEMYKLVYSAAPSVFRNAGPGCVCGACPEGKKSCGKMTEVRKKYESIRNECRHDNCN